MNKGIFIKLIEAIKYYFESKKGLYSLDTYMDIVSEYVDNQILVAEKEEKLSYIGGQCQVSIDEKETYIIFLVKLYFKDMENNNKMKEALRKKTLSSFTSDTRDKVGGGLTFEVDKPGGEK